MPEKQCVRCGEANPGEANFCSSCGGSAFRDVPPGLAQRLEWSGVAPASPALRLSTGRVVGLSVLSFGFYFLWWFYITWKQLASETGDDHRPVWHALSLFVPIYGLFRLHRHMSVIKELSMATSLSPGAVVVVTMVSGALGFYSAIRIDDPTAVLVIDMISLAFTTFVVAWAQGALNQHWHTKLGPALQDARIGVGEVVIVILGLLAWVGTFLPE